MQRNIVPQPNGNSCKATLFIDGATVLRRAIYPAIIEGVVVNLRFPGTGRLAICNIREVDARRNTAPTSGSSANASVVDDVVVCLYRSLRWVNRGKVDPGTSVIVDHVVVDMNVELRESVRWAGRGRMNLDGVAGGIIPHRVPAHPDVIYVGRKINAWDCLVPSAIS